MMISNMAPYSSICLKTAPNMLPEAPRTVQDGSNKPQTPQGSPQEAQTQQQLHENLCCLHRHPFASDGFPKPQHGDRLVQEGPKKRPKRAPRRPQERTGTLQKRPKR